MAEVPINYFILVSVFFNFAIIAFEGIGRILVFFGLSAIIAFKGIGRILVFSLVFQPLLFLQRWQDIRLLKVKIEVD